MISLLELHLSQSPPEVVAGHLFHVVKLEELVPPVAVHVDEHVAVFVGSKRLRTAAGGGDGTAEAKHKEREKERESDGEGRRERERERER